MLVPPSRNMAAIPLSVINRRAFSMRARRSSSVIAGGALWDSIDVASSDAALTSAPASAGRLMASVPRAPAEPPTHERRSMTTPGARVESQWYPFVASPANQPPAGSDPILKLGSDPIGALWYCAQCLDQLDLPGVINGVAGDAQHKIELLAAVQGRGKCSRPDVGDRLGQPRLSRLHRRANRLPGQRAAGELEPVAALDRERARIRSRQLADHRVRAKGMVQRDFRDVVAAGSRTPKSRSV